jgi:hypothetical protein
MSIAAVGGVMPDKHEQVENWQRELEFEIPCVSERS